MASKYKSNRKRGDRKRPRRKAPEKSKVKTLCFNCTTQFKKPKDAITCDDCENLFHIKCSRIMKKCASEPATYLCTSCFLNHVSYVSSDDNDPTESDNSIDSNDSSDSNDLIDSYEEEPTKNQCRSHTSQDSQDPSINDQILALLKNNNRTMTKNHKELTAQLDRIELSSINSHKN
jgi:hypothetical protein